MIAFLIGFGVIVGALFTLAGLFLLSSRYLGHPLAWLAWLCATAVWTIGILVTANFCVYVGHSLGY